MKRMPGSRGIMLITSYVLLSAFVLYANSMMIHSMSKSHEMGLLRDRLQALDLAQGASQQLREDVFFFISQLVTPTSGDIMLPLEWLDSLGDVLRGDADQEEFGLIFEVFDHDVTGDGLITVADGDLDRDATSGDNARAIALPEVTGGGYAKAWLLDVCADESADQEGDPEDCKPDRNPFADRLLTVQSEARVGAITKKIRAVYRIALGPSRVFRYGYFVNNYGWFSVGADDDVFVYGEVRANGDLEFSGELENFNINGDLYAGRNPSLNNPRTLLPSVGQITGDPGQAEVIWECCGAGYEYMYKNSGARPARRLFNPSQPAIGGSPVILPEGQGWETEHPDFPEQRRFTAQSVEPMPYMGDMTVYERVATSSGGTLTYLTPGADGEMYTGDDQWATINGVYRGPDGIEGVNPDTGINDDAAPLVLIGGADWYQIQVDGPVVVPGDVIIKGVISGRGTIYSGRNVHIVGDLSYDKPTIYPSLLREQTTGQLKDWTGLTGYVTDYPYYNIGRVCDDGTYIAPISPTESAPACP